MPISRLFGAFAAAAALLGACSSASTTKTSTTTVTVADITAAHTGLCAAIAAATNGDEEAAGVTFTDRVHGGLHDLASRVEERDRSVAARLLEAKERVEADLDQSVTAAALTADLINLAPNVRAAIALLGDAMPEPCPEESP